MTQMQWRQMSQIMFMKLATMHYFTTSSVILSSIQFYLYTLIHAWLCHGISVSIRGLGVGCRVLYWTTDHGNVAKLGLAKLWNVLINPFLKIICTNYFGTKRRRGGGLFLCFFVFCFFFYRTHILFFIAMWDFTVLPLFFFCFLYFKSAMLRDLISALVQTFWLLTLNVLRYSC